MPSPATRARQLAEQLVEVIEDTIADFDDMPFFVRPMVRRGFEKRTRRSLDQWMSSARALVDRLRQDGASRASIEQAEPSLLSDLAALQENYRTTPVRAGRAMAKIAPATLRVIEQQSERREKTVAELQQALLELP